MCGAVPPDRSAELEKLRFEIYGIERKLEAIHKLKEGALPPKIRKALYARVVPPDNGFGLTRRRKSRHEKIHARKGVELVRENLVIWKSKQRMQEMFMKEKLCRGAVPTSGTELPIFGSNQQQAKPCIQ